MALSDISRRSMLARSAALAAGLGLSMSVLAGQRKALAKVDPEPDESKDNDVLNALLKAEYDAVATYNAGAGIIAADMATPKATRDTVTGVAVHFRDQHVQHAAALKRLIESNGGTPAADTGKPTLPASFPAASANTTDVIKLATDKEKQAAYTYAQVMASISTQTAAKLVASIGAVETQHFVVLYLLAEGLIEATAKTGMSPTLVVPAAFILDVGGPGTANLEKFQALDDLLAFDKAS
jgi:rubrerythrin